MSRNTTHFILLSYHYRSAREISTKLPEPTISRKSSRARSLFQSNMLDQTSTCTFYKQTSTLPTTELGVEEKDIKNGNGNGDSSRNLHPSLQSQTQSSKPQPDASHHQPSFQPKCEHGNDEHSHAYGMFPPATLSMHQELISRSNGSLYR
jgi:hypothetical protein